VPKKAKPAKVRPLYKSPPPKPVGRVSPQAEEKPPERGYVTRSTPQHKEISCGSQSRAPEDFPHAQPIAPAHFELREDGSIQTRPQIAQNSADSKNKSAQIGEISGPKLVFSFENPFLRLYHGNALELLDAIAAKYPEGRFDAIFADPPYFLSNGGITCHAGRMVKVDKGDWDKSRGPELNHEFNLE